MKELHTMLEELKKQVCEANLLLPEYGISLFVLVFTSWVSGTCWNTAYQNPATAGLIAMADRAVDYNTAQKGSFAFCVINLIGMICSVPLWQMLGLC